MYTQIFKNTSWLIIAQVITKAVSFFYVIFLASNLGVENFGLYSVALSYYSLISAFSDFGISRYLVREVAKDQKKLPEILSCVIFLRVTLTAVIFAIFAVLMYNFDPSKIRVALSLIAVLAVLPQTIAISLDSVFVAFQRLSYSAFSLVIFNIASAVTGFMLIKGGYGTFGAVFAIILGQIVYAACLFIFLAKQKIFLKIKIRETLFGEIIKGSLPYGLLAILGLLYFKIDTLLLSYMKGSFDTGIYSAAYKFLEAIVFVPTTFAVIIFPVFAKMHNTETIKIRQLYFNSLKIMGGLGMIVLLGYLLILPNIIRIFLPAYTSAIDVIKILSFSIPFMFLHVPATQLLLSTDKYLKPIVFISIGMLICNVLLNMIFIPRFSYTAASLITVGSEILSFLVFFAFLQTKVFRE